MTARSDSEDGTIPEAPTSPLANSITESMANDNKQPTVEEIPDEEDCSHSQQSDDANGMLSQPADPGHPSVTDIYNLDPNLIEIIEEIGDDDEDHETEDDTEIQEISELEIFTETLKRAQEVAVAREREQEKGRKRPHIYTKNKEKTQERRAKFNRDMHAKGFLSVGAFFEHVKDKITKENSTSGVAGPQALDCQPETPEQVSAVVGGMPEEQSGSVEEKEEEEEGETENDRDNDLRGTATSENIPADPSMTAAQQKVAEILEELRAGRILQDDSLATASDLALDQLHYKDLPALHRGMSIFGDKEQRQQN
ncbi:hypothetical protein K438DRAFT_1991947 [Mycena galopus ATCC 62051]|nr:hypothetical protein K438DRAFT_1991947 [Mycena galopus ATCC 62051]